MKSTILALALATLASVASAAIVPGDVVINEFLANPVGTATDGTNSEYIELLVVVTSDLSGVTISDRSFAGALGATEGDLTFPNTGFTSVPAGTYIIIYLAVPVANTGVVEDLNAADKKIVLRAGGPTLIANGTSVVDISTNENLVLWAGAANTGQMVDYIATGTNTSQTSFTDVNLHSPAIAWGTTNITGGSDRNGVFVPAVQNTVAGFKNNDTAAAWTSVTPATGLGTPGLVNAGVNDSVLAGSPPPASTSDWNLYSF